MPYGSFDHQLVARAQSRATGANVHDLQSLLTAYYGFTDLARTDPQLGDRVQMIEQRLRAFCHTGRVPRDRDMQPEPALVLC